jgi:hypothetical protein
MRCCESYYSALLRQKPSLVISVTHRGHDDRGSWAALLPPLAGHRGFHLPAERAWRPVGQMRVTE